MSRKQCKFSIIMKTAKTIVMYMESDYHDEFIENEDARALDDGL